MDRQREHFDPLQMSDFQLKDNQTVASQIYKTLRERIINMQLPPGVTMSEQETANALGVSRTPVREAIRRLEQENILEDTGRGAVVVGISREDMMDMYDMRLNIEGMSARRAARNISPEELAEMREVVELQRFYIDKSDGDNSDQIKNLDSQFHELLYKSSGSKAFYDTLSSMHKKMTKFRKASVSNHSRAVRALEEHVAIMEALGSHDEELAEKLTLRHVLNARSSMTGLEI